MHKIPDFNCFKEREPLSPLTGDVTYCLLFRRRSQHARVLADQSIRLTSPGRTFLPQNYEWGRIAEKLERFLKMVGNG